MGFCVLFVFMILGPPASST